MGDAIRKSIQLYFSPLLGKKSIAILAAFSIGGNGGINKKNVSDAIGINIVELWEVVSKLAAGGVVWNNGNDCLSVYPVALRCALIKDVFFSDSGLPMEVFLSLLNNAPSTTESISVLIGVKAINGQVDDYFLFDSD